MLSREGATDAEANDGDLLRFRWNIEHESHAGEQVSSVRRSVTGCFLERGKCDKQTGPCRQHPHLYDADAAESP